MKVFVALAVIAFVGASLVEGRSIRDLKSTLTTKGNDLVKRADEAITKLQADHKTHEVAMIKAEEATIKKLLADLESADSTHLTRIEHELARAEAKLQHQLDAVNHHSVPHLPDPHHGHIPAKRDLKSALITRGNDLLKKAEEAVTKLETDKKTHEVTIVKAEEAAIKKLIADLEAATETSTIAHLEHSLAAAEIKLQFELLKIGHHHVEPHIPHHEPHVPHIPHKRDLKSTLTTKGNNLVKRADEAITKLQADHKTHEVAMIKAEEAAIKKLLADLETADATHLIRIEHELARAETKLQHQLDHLNHVPRTTKAPAKRDLKSDLLTKAKNLETKAEAEIKKLEAAHKAHEVTVIKHEEAAIKKLVSAVEAETDATKLTHLEHQLAQAEHKLQFELQKLEHTPHTHTPRTTTVSF